MGTKYEVRVLNPKAEIIGFISTKPDYMTTDKRQMAVFGTYYDARRVANVFEAKHAFKTKVVPSVPNARDDIAPSYGHGPARYQGTMGHHKWQR